MQFARFVLDLNGYYAAMDFDASASKRSRMKALEGMFVRLELAKTRKDSDRQTTLARICVEHDRAIARCVACGCHRLTLTPKMIDFLMAVVATMPDAKAEVIAIRDGRL